MQNWGVLLARECADRLRRALLHDKCPGQVCFPRLCVMIGVVNHQTPCSRQKESLYGSPDRVGVQVLVTGSRKPIDELEASPLTKSEPVGWALSTRRGGLSNGHPVSHHIRFQRLCSIWLETPADQSPETRKGSPCRFLTRLLRILPYNNNCRASSRYAVFVKADCLEILFIFHACFLVETFFSSRLFQTYY
jgi:hypothetical protein